MSFELDDLRAHNSELLNLLTEHLPDMLWVKDAQGKYLYVNKAICDGLLMAKNTSEPIGKDDVFFALREREAHRDDPNWHTFGELCFNSDQTVIDNNRPMRFEEYGNVKGKLLYLEVFKAPFYDEDGTILGTVGAGRDITALKMTQIDLQKSLQLQKEQQQQLEYQASHDLLTDLPNRVLFRDRLEQSIERARRYGNIFAVLFIDLDHFKEINDSLGHTIGDKVLVETSRRLRGLIKNTDTLSRFGGDEFCVILNAVGDVSGVEKVIKRYKEAMKEAFEIDNSTLHVSISVGIALYPDNGISASELLKNADAAMFRAKTDGRNTHRYYDEEMTLKAYERLFIETELRKALGSDQLCVYFQPQIDARDETLIGMEVLVRWNHPNMGFVMPDRFIPLAEQNGMIVELDRLVMKKAFALLAQWRAEGLNPPKVSVNLSMKQIEEEDFIDVLETLVCEAGITYADIEFEVTETQIMHNPEASIQILERLNRLGVSIAVDDFGTGYSSLAYLKRLPIHKLKIDKSFVDNLPRDLEDVAISKTVIGLSEILNFSVIAEGVETAEQQKFLLENGCEHIQGFFYSKPLRADEMAEYLKTKVKE